MGVYLVELGDFLQLAVNESYFALTYYDINTLLTNNLNKYHPYGFFFTATIFILTALVGLVVTRPTSRCFKNSLIFRRINYLVQLLFLCSVITLFLGSW